MRKSFFCVSCWHFTWDFHIALRLCGNITQTPTIFNWCLTFREMAVPCPIRFSLHSLSAWYEVVMQRTSTILPKSPYCLCMCVHITYVRYVMNRVYQKWQNLLENFWFRFICNNFCVKLKRFFVWVVFNEISNHLWPIHVTL